MEDIPVMTVPMPELRCEKVGSLSTKNTVHSNPPTQNLQIQEPRVSAKRTTLKEERMKVNKLTFHNFSPITEHQREYHAVQKRTIIMI